MHRIQNQPWIHRNLKYDWKLWRKQRNAKLTQTQATRVSIAHNKMFEGIVYKAYCPWACWGRRWASAGPQACHSSDRYSSTSARTRRGRAQGRDPLLATPRPRRDCTSRRRTTDRPFPPRWRCCCCRGCCSGPHRRCCSSLPLRGLARLTSFCLIQPPPTATPRCSSSHPAWLVFDTRLLRFKGDGYRRSFKACFAFFSTIRDALMNSRRRVQWQQPPKKCKERKKRSEINQVFGFYLVHVHSLSWHAIASKKFLPSFV